MRPQRRLILLFALAAALPALAFDRVFPPEAKRGRMTPGYFPAITMDGQPRQLSAGARIFNRHNTIEMLGAISGSDIVVNYTEDGQGYINRVWILTAEEAQQDMPDPTATPDLTITHGTTTITVGQ
jgi:hypothetical protein